MSEPIFSHDDHIDIAAPPEAVYALVSDMTRYGEWSTQNVGGEWLDGGSGKVGDWFEVTEIRGHIEEGKVAHYQVGLKVGFRLE